MKFKEDEVKIGLLAFVASIVGVLAMVLRVVVFGRPYFVFLIWNLFLAMIPLYLSLIMSCFGCTFKKWWLLIAGMWLLFYPNAPYMITDFIHIPKNVFILAPNIPIKIQEWGDLLIAGYFSALGFWMGLESLKRVFCVVLKRKSWIHSFFMVSVVQFLSSSAIFMGRFWRLNSWDVKNPKLILEALLNSIQGKGLSFTLMFWVFLMTTFALFSFGTIEREQKTVRYNTRSLWSNQ